MPYQMVRLEKVDGVAIITLNRPEKLNAFNMEMTAEIDMALDEAAQEKEVKAIILTGAGRTFSTGIDLNWAATVRGDEELPSMASTVRGRMVTHGEKSFMTVVLKIQNMPKPVIAAINGIAMGGAFVLALACDLKIASENAEFSMPQVKRGLIPDGAGTYLLPRAVGLTKALELALICDSIDGREAERIGLVNKVVPHDSLMAAAREMATKIANNAPLAVAMTKAAMYKGIQEHDVAAHMDYEVYIMNILFATEDFQEGISSIWEKREPIFKGR
ncbi:MAG TPA: enoyl-CoA hydratase/isomerase family protein [Dehalococcoidia bacterium]|nr:enoyl-CoA hydratase/isomerase family protein [Dehalococcoidia bacterium]